VINSTVVEQFSCGYSPRVSRLTKEEQTFLCVVIGLLLVGWAVKAYRTAHPASVAAQEVIQ
jgi:hypothetical protein